MVVRSSGTSVACISVAEAPVGAVVGVASCMGKVGLLVIWKDCMVILSISIVLVGGSIVSVLDKHHSRSINLSVVWRSVASWDNNQNNCSQQKPCYIYFYNIKNLTRTSY